jgi:hypothetical protein
LPNPARQLTVKVVPSLTDADGAKAPKNVYLEIAKDQAETQQTVLNGFSNRVSALNVLSTQTVDLAQTTLFVGGVPTTMFVVKLITMA